MAAVTTPNNKRRAEAFSASTGTEGKMSARLIGSGLSGVSELFLFHPVDTVAKRLMSNQTQQVYVKGDTAATITNANKVIFKHAADQGAFVKWKSMFPGLGFAAGYKIMQRTYKFGGQPYMKEYINQNHGHSFEAAFGKTTGKTMASAVAGSLMGVGEVALLPLDVLKIKAQTNPEVLKGRGVMEIFRTEGMGLYRGAGWTAARNAPGSFALFGGSAFVHNTIFKKPAGKDTTFFQNFCASIGGAISSITVAAPLDVIKTRIQNKPFDAPESGMQIIRNLVKNEGMSAFFKGLTPKIIVVGPKLVFSFTVAQTVIQYLEERL